jgi:SpoVK/Ycf46/Vps4 family AAA+-type ATPase
MATAEQIKMLIQSHLEKNDDRFRTVVLQLAAYEANQGHNAFAREIRTIIDKAKSEKGKIVPFNKELSDLLYSTISEHKLSELVVMDELRSRVDRILKEFRQQDKLKKHGLCNRRKILLAGPPGTGKTMTASVLAAELNLPLCTIVMDKLITKYMGETSVKLRQIFDTIKETEAVFLFDEFDAIGTERSRDNDVGEIRRVLNSFLQFIEQDDSKSIIVAATNNLFLLDQALFRRFDDVLHYKLPADSEIRRLIINRLGEFRPQKIKIDNIIRIAESLSHSEISKACDDAIKEAILCDLSVVDEGLLSRMIEEKKVAYQRGDK